MYPLPLISELHYTFKGSIFLKKDISIQERFNKLIYGIC